MMFAHYLKCIFIAGLHLYYCRWDGKLAVRSEGE